MENQNSVAKTKNLKPNLYLVGFMATGKSAIGRRVALALDMQFLDSDAEIEKKMKMPVSDIFKNFGEEKFRELEREFIENGHPESGCVISCGGGLTCRDDMPQLVKSKGISICLFLPPETILERSKFSNKRPLLNVDNPLEKIRSLLEERKKFYLKSGILVALDGKNLEEASDTILRVYKNTLSQKKIRYNK